MKVGKGRGIKSVQRVFSPRSSQLRCRPRNSRCYKMIRKASCALGCANEFSRRKHLGRLLEAEGTRCDGSENKSEATHHFRY